VEYLIVCLVAFFASSISFFSGFGLGTVLVPAFALFFPIPLAISLTAIVHILNNLFKFTLIGKHAQLRIVFRFGVPAFVGALLGASLLLRLNDLAPVASYEMWGKERVITLINVIVGTLIAIFAILELTSFLKKVSVGDQWLSLGGALSGFFGGLSGHQGALRSAFLIKCGFTREAFIGTGVLIALMVDLGRLSIYRSLEVSSEYPLLASATLAACLGAWLSRKWLPKVSFQFIHLLVSCFLLLTALGLISGLI